MQAIHTLGHGTLSAEQFLAVVASAGVDLVIDVRRYPGSRRHPHYTKDEMAVWLPGDGIAYRWIPALGGRRTPEPDSPNTGWRNPQFRAYADHMATAEFAAGIRELKEAAAVHQAAAVMCSESVWWRCHRRLLADHLLLIEEIPVLHLFHDGRLAAHEALDGVRRDGSHLTYPGEESDQRSLF